MKIQNSLPQIHSLNFKGHEAKKLDRILVHQNKAFGADAILKQLDAIASKHKVHVERVKYFPDTWIQDEIYFTPNKKVISSNYRYATGYADLLGLEPDEITNNENTFRTKHIDGGNLFFVTDKDGKQVILSGKNKEGYSEIDGYENVFEADKVITLPRADYHLDLFITPIGNNKILVADDDLMLDGLDKILEACVMFIEENPEDKSSEDIREVAVKLLDLIDSFSDCKHKYLNKDSEKETAKILKDNGFEVIPVPSRIYNFTKWHSPKNRENLTHQLNYSNAITFKNDKNETVLIAAKSGLEKQLGLTDTIAKKIGIDFETLFRDAVSKHIKPENVHFINGDGRRPISSILEECKGGLHCMCVEVPDYYNF